MTPVDGARRSGTGLASVAAESEVSSLITAGSAGAESAGGGDEGYADGSFVRWDGVGLRRATPPAGLAGAPAPWEAPGGSGSVREKPVGSGLVPRGASAATPER